MKRYIRESDLRAITEGSFERKRQACMEAIDAFEKTSASAAPRPLALVATFEHHAVVADGKGGLHRYAFAEGRVKTRTEYEGFATMTESEARKDAASIIEAAAEDAKSGKDLTDSILKLLRL